MRLPFIHRLLARPAVEAMARVLLTAPFWLSGLAKLIDFPGGIAEMRMAGLEPAWLVNAATVLLQLCGSALVIARRAVWLGAGALGVFTALTILLVHRFWAIEGPMGIVSLHVAAEHVGMIGGLVLVSILGLRQAPERDGAAGNVWRPSNAR